MDTISTIKQGDTIMLDFHGTLYVGKVQATTTKEASGWEIDFEDSHGKPRIWKEWLDGGTLTRVNGVRVCKCENCLQTVALYNPLTNECTCGTLFNGFGQELAPRHEWGDDFYQEIE